MIERNFPIQRITDATRIRPADDRARHLSCADLAVAAPEFATYRSYKERIHCQPDQQPSKVELRIILKTARTLGLAFPIALPGARR
jgi:hypothetical protein